MTRPSRPSSERGPRTTSSAVGTSGRQNARPFAHHQYGAPLIQSPERTGGRYCLYRFHGDNPVTFTRYLKHTIEHGHANDRADSFYSCCFWYQDRKSVV